MRRPVRHAAALSWGLLLASIGASGALSMDKIVCTVSDKQSIVGADYGDRLCAKVASALGATAISRREMNAYLAGKQAIDALTRLHVVAVTIPSDREIAFTYAFGTAAQWRDHSQSSFDDLAIDVMDASVSDGTISVLAETVLRLSR